jgi:cytoskeleton protein RodZ
MNSVPSERTHKAGAPGAMHPPAHDDEGISCGEFLRRARERRGLTLQQVADDTKIPLRHLHALERDEFAALPAGMYRRAEVRAYAEAIGLDRSVALSLLDRGLERTITRTPSGVQVALPPPTVARGRRRVLIAAAIAVTTGAIALVVWARQPGAGDGVRLAAPISAASSEVPAQTTDDVLPPATSDNPVEASSGPTTAVKPSEPAPSEPAPSGLQPELTLITEPAGARVTVNGVGWGITPLTIRYIEPGAKRVRVTLDGYRAEERLVQVDAGRRAMTVRIPLRADAETGLIPGAPDNEGPGN